MTKCNRFNQLKSIAGFITLMLFQVFVIERVEAQALNPYLTSLSLINTTTDSAYTNYSPIANYSIVNLARENGGVNIQANTGSNGNDIGSVVYEINNTFFRVENFAPFSLFGDANGDFVPGNISPGFYTVTAKAYTGKNGSGALLGSVSASFSVVNNYTTIQEFEEKGLTLLTRGTNVAGIIPEDFVETEWLSTVPGGIPTSYMINPNINSFFDQATIYLGIYPNLNFSIGSVLFGWDNNPSLKIESIAPYALFGDTNGAFNFSELPVGEHILNITIFSAGNLSGSALYTAQIKVTIENQ
jgi:trimeric autotransporter adhesin